MSNFAEVVLPNLGFGMEEGKLIAWLKKAGDDVRKGDPIAEIESDKSTVELEAVVDGVIEAILVEADQMVPVGTVLARIRVGAVEPLPASNPALAPSSTAAVADAGRASPVAQRMASEHGIDLSAIPGSGPGGRITREDVEAQISTPGKANGNSRPEQRERALAAPKTRKLARDAGVDLNQVRGTGEGGRVTRADLEALLRQPTHAPPPLVAAPSASEPGMPMQAGLNAPEAAATERTEIKLSNMRQTIARRLVQSAQDAPHFYATAEVDLTDALRALPPGTGINALVLHLTVGALQDIPELNATYENGHLFQYTHVHLAVAVALPAGLMTPVLQRADDYSLAGLADRIRDLVSRTRSGKLRPEELGGGTFTVSNLGIIQQVDRFTAIINPPQVGILAVGAAKERPVVKNGGLHIRTTAHLTLSADHRIIDGLVAGRFLEAFDNRLSNFSS